MGEDRQVPRLEAVSVNTGLLVDVVIINWNSPVLVADCLASLRAGASPRSVSVFVVDNSRDLDEGELASADDSITLIRPDSNLGFGGGCNLGAARGSAPFILFLNPDIVFPPGGLARLLDFLRSARLPEDVGVIGLRLLNPDGSQQKNIARFPRFSHLLPRMIGLDRLCPRVFPPHYLTSLDYSRNQRVEQVPGACLLMRRALFERLGGFDERFFLYYEDVDLCFRAHQAGWQALYLADIAVYHQGGGSTSAIRARRLFYLLRSRVLYCAKHFGRPHGLLILLAVLLLEYPVRLLRALLRFSSAEARGTLRSLAMFLAGLPSLLACLLLKQP